MEKLTPIAYRKTSQPESSHENYHKTFFGRVHFYFDIHSSRWRGVNGHQPAAAPHD
jgi:hypothetical protein